VESFEWFGICTARLTWALRWLKGLFNCIVLNEVLSETDLIYQN
jgi:hypothetical protein